MKLNALRALVAAVEEGSLRSAARSLGLTQPALSKMIRELERSVGAPLLQRSTQGVIPTAQGKVLAERAMAAERELRTGLDQIRQLGGQMSGELSIGAVPLALMLLMPEAMRSFGAEYPGILLRINEELYVEQLARLRKGEVDVAIGPVPQGLSAGEVLVETLMPIQMVVVVRRGHPLQHARRLRELQDARWVFTGTTPEAGYARRLFEQNGLPPPRVGAFVNSTLGLLSLIAGGEFIGLLPLQIAQHPMTRPYLEIVHTVEGPLQATLGAMVRVERAPTPAVRHFLAHLHRAAHHVLRAE